MELRDCIDNFITSICMIRLHCSHFHKTKSQSVVLRVNSAMQVVQKKAMMVVLVKGVDLPREMKVKFHLMHCFRLVLLELAILGLLLHLRLPLVASNYYSIVHSLLSIMMPPRIWW